MVDPKRSERRAPQVRGASMRKRVLTATISELAELGYAGLSIENIADRAEVHKTTIYRNWGGLDALVSDVLSEHAAEEVPIPDTGSIDGDLHGLAEGLANFLQSDAGRSNVAVMLSGAAHNSEVSAVRDRVFRDRFRRASVVVDRAVKRGELPAETNSDLVLKSLIAPIYFEFLYAGEPPTSDIADRAARVTVIAAKNGDL